MINFSKNTVTTKCKASVYIFITLSFLCLVPVFLSIINWLTLGMPIYQVLIISVLAFAIFFLPFLMFKMRVAFLVNTLYVLLAPLELFSLFYYKSLLREGPVILILQSNLQEALEFLMMYKLYIVLYLIVIAFYLFLIIFYVKNNYLFSRKKRIMLLICTLAIFFGMYAYCVKRAYKSTNSFQENKKNIGRAYREKIKKVYPCNVFLSIKNGYKIFNGFKFQSAEIDDFLFYATPKYQMEEKEIYVLVIGETARYTSFSINGYYRETTPLLAETSNIVSFSDVYTQSNSTVFSMPMLLTRSSVLNFDAHKKEKTVVDAFKEAGFSTYWIGNQSYDDAFVQSIASRTTDTFIAIKDFEDVDCFDEYLWKYFDEILSKNEQKQFIVIHTLGSHFRYNLRYPDTFIKFQPTLTGLTNHAMISRKIKEELVNSYDNSILYTDFFLANTIKKIDKKDAVSYLFYISDHGENIYDNDSDMIFHGSAQPAKEEIHVPLITWVSDKYNTYFSEKAQAIKDNIDKKTSSQVVFYSLLDMANIDIKGNDLSRSIANPTMTEDSIRYVMTPNYDILAY